MTREERLARYREQRNRAAKSVRKIDKGRLNHEDCDFDPAKDVTADWRETKRQEVDMLDRLISEEERAA